MRELLVKSALVLACVSLVACSTNTRGTNTAIGAVSGGAIGGLAGSAIGGGAAIGVGIVAGAIVGGLIGNSMDSSDHTQMTYAMNNNPTNKGTTWRNAKTGATYKIVPTSRMMTIDGHPNCRHFYTTAIINGKKQKVYGVACRQTNGTWKAIRS